MSIFHMHRKILVENAGGEAFKVKEIYTLLLLEQKTLKESTFSMSQSTNYYMFQYKLCFIAVSFCLSDTEQNRNTNPSSLTPGYENNFSFSLINGKQKNMSW